MYLYDNFKPKIGLISITDTPRAVGMVDEREKFVRERHESLKKFLLSEEIKVIDPSDYPFASKDKIGICSSEDIQKTIDIFSSNHVEAIIVGCWHWAEPMLVIELVRALNKPVLLYADNATDWAATCLITATGASLWEVCPNRSALVHERVYGDKESLLSWIMVGSRTGATLTHQYVSSSRHIKRSMRISRTTLSC